jgi:8-oxo-dGTP diphosphatase
MTIVKFYDPSYVPDSKLTYSVIAARFKDKWLFVRHKDRTTWEIAGGHIEENESPFDAASRELAEETGAKDFRLDCVATYSVEKDGSTGFGRLFFADVLSLGELPDNSEIKEVILNDHLPESLTYPDIQPLLFRRVIEYSEGENRI